MKRLRLRFGMKHSALRRHGWGLAAGGPYSVTRAAMDHAAGMLAIRTDYVRELTYPERKQIHNLKYYTWVEQQGHTAEELNRLWYDPEGTWESVHRDIGRLDELIQEFNAATAE